MKDVLEHEVEAMQRKLDEMGQKKNANGPKAFAGVIALIALITGIGAIVRPMQISIANMQTQMLRMETRIEQQIKDHARSLGHAGLSTNVSENREKFREVETQFRGLRDTMVLHNDAIRERVTKLEVGGNPAHEERIRALERGVYGKARQNAR